MKKLLLLLVFFSAVVVASPALALGPGGCTNTPENPTLVLAGLASGVFGVRQLHSHLRSRRAAKSARQQD